MGLLLQTVDRCNGRCIMCPYSSLGKTGPPNLMEDRLYLHILHQARRAGTLRSVVLMLQNEPLLDCRLGKRVRMAREALGNRVRIGLVTNGSLLTEQRVEELIDNGVERIEVSLDAYDERTYGAIRQGLDFAQVVENIRKLLQHPRRPDVTVRFLRLQRNKAEERDFVRYWRPQGARVYIMHPSNRAGALEGFERLAPLVEPALSTRIRAAFGRFLPCCMLPFASLSVFWDGRVPLCCQDWGPKDIIGDLSRQSLHAVWQGEPMRHYRHLLCAHRTEESTVCRDCSVVSGQGGPAD